ncbi:hypothetical protein FGO68_gene3973 [Halteria grandinella]|uniref:Uncharacterized protein n=1 Tax=Halteria grandinella TaxID=5974 RepID=A0A8J8SUM5_HALGN|nr:hypothetical protein FGO68_gene3973 [Halteria grandinella]
MMSFGRARYLVESSRSASGAFPETADDDSWNLVDSFSLNSWISCLAMSSTRVCDVIEEIVVPVDSHVVTSFFASPSLN